MRLKKILGITFVAVILSSSPVMAAPSTVSGLSSELVCQCGCTMVLLNCSHAECSSREAMTGLIKQQIDQGQSGEQIIQLFVAQYGEQVLSSPTKKGFNLTAWLLPVVVLVLGGGLIYGLLKKWVGQGENTQAVSVVEEGDEEYQHQLEEELQDFTERGFR